jgi:hypothetical protein
MRQATAALNNKRKYLTHSFYALAWLAENLRLAENLVEQVRPLIRDCSSGPSLVAAATFDDSYRLDL